MPYLNCPVHGSFSVPNIDMTFYRGDVGDSCLCPECGEDWKYLEKWIESLGFHLVEPVDLRERDRRGIKEYDRVREIRPRELPIPPNVSRDADTLLEWKIKFYVAIRLLRYGEYRFGRWELAYDREKGMYMVAPLHFPEGWWYIEFDFEKTTD